MTRLFFALLTLLFLSGPAMKGKVDFRQSPLPQSEQQRAVEAVRAAVSENPGVEVNIYGYSRGGIGAIGVAGKLEKAGIGVDNLILVDPVTVTGNRGGLRVPSKVANAESHYQRGKREGALDFPGTPLRESGPGRRNKIYPGPHGNMPNDFKR